MPDVLTPDDLMPESPEAPPPVSDEMEPAVPDAPVADTGSTEPDDAGPPEKAVKPKDAPKRKRAATTAPKAASTAKKKAKAKQEPKQEQEPAPAPSPPPPARPVPERPERILGADGNWVEDDELPVSDDMYQIASAHNTHRIVTAALAGYEKQDGLKPVAVCYYGDVKVIIPLSEMEIHLENLSDDDHYNNIRYSQIIDSMIGAKIDFMVKGYDENGNLAVGSRREAMERKRRTILNATQRDGTYRIYEGLLVEGRVTNVHEKVARIEIFGLEARLRAGMIYNTWIDDLHKVLSPGDTVKCKIIGLERGTNGDVTRLEVSMRDINREKELQALERINVGSRYVGKVMRRRGKLLFVRLKDTDIDVGCQILGGMTADVPYIGTTVKVLISRKGTYNNQLYGTITRVMSKFRPHINR